MYHIQQSGQQTRGGLQRQLAKAQQRLADERSSHIETLRQLLLVIELYNDAQSRLQACSRSGGPCPSC